MVILNEVMEVYELTPPAVYNNPGLTGSPAAYVLRLFPPCAFSSHAQGSSGVVATSVPFVWRGRQKAAPPLGPGVRLTLPRGWNHVCRHLRTTRRRSCANTAVRPIGGSRSALRSHLQANRSFQGPSSTRILGSFQDPSQTRMRHSAC